MHGGMSPSDFLGLDGFRRNSSVGKLSWYWAPKLEHHDWTPFFERDRLRHVVLSFYEDFQGERKPIDDALVEALLGPAHGATRIGPRWGPFAPPTREHPWLASARNLTWRFGWGSVESCVEPRDWTPRIAIHWRP